MKNEKNKKALFWVYKSFKKFIPQTVLMCLTSVAVSLLFIYLAFLSKNVLELATKQREGSFLFYGIAFAVVVFLQVILSGGSSIMRTAVAGKLTIDMRERLFKTLNRKKYSAIEGFHSGDVLNRFTADTDVIVSNTVSILPDICSMLAKIIGGAAALILLEWKLAIIIVLFGLIVPAIGRLINKRYKHLHKECIRTEGVTRSFLQECFENTIVIKTFKSEVPFTKRLKLYMKDNYRFKLKRAWLSVLSHLSLYSFFTVGYYAVLVWGAISIAKGTITFGVLIAFLQLVSQLRGPLQNLSGIIPKYYAVIASAERLLEFEALENEPPTKEKTLPYFESLNVEDINFSYDTKPILKGFNLNIEKGSITAITGPSGSGKSTLFKLFLGLYEPICGSITINNDLNVDAATRPLFAYVPQGNMILSGSIIDNLTMCNADIPLSDVIKACKIAEIHDYIISLEDGYDTVLNERGGGFSEGQLQRLSIARALITDAPILLLDEATSALDKVTELRVLANIKSLKDKTVILVTHRKTSIEFCDTVISMQ